jgi:hypothetical protein
VSHASWLSAPDLSKRSDPRSIAAVGRPRHLSLLGFLVACQLNAIDRHHQGHLVEVARTLNAITARQRLSLGVTSWDPDESYPRVARLFSKLCQVLESGEAGVDAASFANQLARAAVPREFLVSHSVAVDGTDVETWGALHGEAVTVELDGEATETQLVEEGSGRREKQPARRAKVLGVGPDGRKRYTADPDARAGHRSATNSRPAGPYVGYELHLAVQARDVRWTNHVDRTTLEPEVPGVITTFNLVPAGTHRGRSIVEGLITAKDGGHEINDVVWDPGYSLCRAESTAYPLAQSGIAQTFQVVTHQRGRRPVSGDALLIDGQLYSPHLPQDLRDLPVPPRGASEGEKEAYEAKFNQRARWRLVRHTGPDADGVTRWRCPFCAGLLRSRQFPKTMRGSRRAPLIQVSADVDRCCSGTFSVAPAELALHQQIPFGTTAWRISMGRRQVVESVNVEAMGLEPSNLLTASQALYQLSYAPSGEGRTLAVARSPSPEPSAADSDIRTAPQPHAVGTRDPRRHTPPARRLGCPCALAYPGGMARAYDVVAMETEVATALGGRGTYQIDNDDPREKFYALVHVPLPVGPGPPGARAELHLR